MGEATGRRFDDLLPARRGVAPAKGHAKDERRHWPRRYMAGIHAQANARPRRKATWLLVMRSSTAPSSATAACTAAKMARDVSCSEKYASSAAGLLISRLSIGLRRHMLPSRDLAARASVLIVTIARNLPVYNGSASVRQADSGWSAGSWLRLCESAILRLCDVVI